MKHAKVRLFVDQPLGPGQTIELAQAQAHYISGVMRMKPGEPVLLFDGASGEWLARIEEAGRKRAELVCIERTRPQSDAADIWLLFAPLKKARMDMVIEKGVELGAARLWPVLTDYTNSERVRMDRLRAQVVEAAEQCGATFVADVEEPQKLGSILKNWPANRAIIFCDEAKAGQDVGLEHLPSAPAAILIGPEGGFSEAERQLIAAHPQAHVISLGPRILRAETAALSALALWQATRGDWTA